MQITHRIVLVARRRALLILAVVAAAFLVATALVAFESRRLLEFRPRAQRPLDWRRARRGL